MFTGIFDPAFLQSACAHAQKPNEIVAHYINNPAMKGIYIWGIGEICVKYMEGGIQKTATFNNPDDEPFGDGIVFDANSDLIIQGDVTRFGIGRPNNTSLYSVDTSKCHSLLAINDINDDACEIIKLNSELTELYVGNLKKISAFYYAANNSAVTDIVKSAITYSTINNGVLHTDSNGAYYTTLAAAATAKGWTIEQL